MNLKTDSNVLKIFLVFTLFFIAAIGVGLAAQNDGNVRNNQEQEELRKLFTEVKNAVQVKDFDKLQKFISRKDDLYWEQCNTDTSKKLSFNNMLLELKKYSKDVKITVADHLLDLIETEGWTGEYAYLYFQFDKVNKNWRWLGVCYDFERSLDYRKELGGKEKYYDSRPKLPRQGPRVFRDVTPLHARIVEILRFKAFDALKPYAIRDKLFVGKSCPDTANNAALIKAGVSVNQVVELLVKNSTDAKEIRPGRGFSFKSKYFLTEGWTGEQPVITFCFAEGKKGWEWFGIAY